VNNMICSKMEGVEFVVADTDAQSLAQSRAKYRIQLGISTTQGLGAGSLPEVGRRAAEEAIDDIVTHLEGCHMCFIVAGMGRGTGTGGSPIVARVAREMGLLTVGVGTRPFRFEGAHRLQVAEAGIDELQQFIDTLVAIPNQSMFRIVHEKTTCSGAFKMADDLLCAGVRSVSDILIVPGLINLDIADVRTVMSEKGMAVMGTGDGFGNGRAIQAAEAAITNPLLGDASLKGARGVLINIAGGRDLTLHELEEITNKIRDEVDQNANIIVGSTFDEKMDGAVRVSVVATGINCNLDINEENLGQCPMSPTVADDSRNSVVSLHHDDAYRRVSTNLNCQADVSVLAPQTTRQPVPRREASLVLPFRTKKTPDTVSGRSDSAEPSLVEPATCVDSVRQRQLSTRDLLRDYVENGVDISEYEFRRLLFDASCDDVMGVVDDIGMVDLSDNCLADFREFAEPFKKQASVKSECAEHHQSD